METLKTQVLNVLTNKKLTFGGISLLIGGDTKELKKELQRLVLQDKVIMTKDDKGKALYTAKKEKQATRIADNLIDIANVDTLKGKDVTIQVSQVDTYGNEIKVKQGFNVTAETLNLMLGKALNRIFQLQDALKDANDSGRFKSTLPISILIESENMQIDTKDLPLSTQNSLRLGGTARRKRLLGRKIWVLTNFIISEPRNVDYLTLDAELAEIEAQEAQERKASK